MGSDSTSGGFDSSSWGRDSTYLGGDWVFSGATKKNKYEWSAPNDRDGYYSFYVAVVTKDQKDGDKIGCSLENEKVKSDLEKNVSD